MYVPSDVQRCFPKYNWQTHASELEYLVVSAQVQYGRLCRRAMMPWSKRVSPRKSFIVPQVCTVLYLTHSRRKRKNLLIFPGSLLTSRDINNRGCLHIPQMQHARSCVLISADPKFFPWRRAHLHDRKEETPECCRRGFTWAPGSISIREELGGLQQKGIYLLSSGLYNKLSQWMFLSVMLVFCKGYFSIRKSWYLKWIQRD